MVNKSIYEGCVTEVYYDEKMKCNVTVILDTSGTLSGKSLEAHKKAKSRGFIDLDHFVGFLYANGLHNEMHTGYDIDILNIHR